MSADQPSLRYVAIGDSLTEGIGDTPWTDGTPRGWADRLALRLADIHPIEYANHAVRGHTSQQVVSAQLQEAIGVSPGLVTITSGMNDILRPRVDFGAVRENLTELVESFTAIDSHILFVPIPRVERVSRVARFVVARRRRLNEIIASFDGMSNVIPLPSTEETVFEDARAWSADKLHLSPLGHTRLAMVVAHSLGIPGNESWAGIPRGSAPSTTACAEIRWWIHEAGPWIGRRLTGRSSGDGRAAKRPVLAPFEPPDADRTGVSDI